MKWLVDKHRTERQFEIGDWVLLKLLPYQQTSLRRQPFHMLAPRYYGPSAIMGKRGPVTYKLALLDCSQIHPIFHVLLLKRATDPPVTKLVVLPKEVQPSPMQPLAILDQKMVKRGNCVATKVLVQWSDLPITKATWEFLYDLQQWFLAVKLEDKVLEGWEN